MTKANPGLFACEQVSFAEPFDGGQEVIVLASFGHKMKNPIRGHGAAIWLGSKQSTGFRICVLEFGDGSNTTAEFNWVALQSAPSGSQIGTTALNSWTTGTECKRIDFAQVSNVFKAYTCDPCANVRSISGAKNFQFSLSKSEQSSKHQLHLASQTQDH